MKILFMLSVVGLLTCKSLNYENVNQEIEDFMIVGISVKTMNKEGKSMKDMGNLWGRFYSDNVTTNIINKSSEEVYVLYTEYENDYRGHYTAIIGHKVKSLENIPEGLQGWKFEGGIYKKITAKGELPGSVIKVWNEIWSKEKQLNRSYRVDFEVYGIKSQKGADSEVDLFISVDK